MPLYVQLGLEEVLGLAAAVEACSEHPLASAVLHFAAVRLGVGVHPAPGAFDAELAAGLQQLEGSSESSPLVGNPGTPKRQRSPVATDWLQPATDIQVEEGESHSSQLVVVTERTMPPGVIREAQDQPKLPFVEPL